MSERAKRILIHAGLFVACCVTTTLAGGVAFGATLMAILACHELGHYVAARVRGVDASLPYFIPLPPIGTFGTLGAVIRMGKPIEDRNALFDVGAAGPIAGLVVAIPLLAVGLSLSTVGPSPADGSQEGNSVLYALLKYAVLGRWLPSDGVDVQLHPMALAAWFGLLVTMINLMPIGQLDGGHVARGARPVARALVGAAARVAAGDRRRGVRRDARRRAAGRAAAAVRNELRQGRRRSMAGVDPDAGVDAPVER